MGGSMDWTILWWLLAGLLVIAGLAGTVIPALPGVPLVFAGLFVCAWIGHFEIISWITVSVLAMLLPSVSWAEVILRPLAMMSELMLRIM